MFVIVVLYNGGVVPLTQILSSKTYIIKNSLLLIIVNAWQTFTNCTRALYSCRLHNSTSFRDDRA